MTYYIGMDANMNNLLGEGNPRYFYALRRDEEGLLYFAKIDQLTDSGLITINNSGLTQNDFPDFEYGVDFFDGRLEEDHSRPYSNLQWDQFRWDTKNAFYYINDNGELIVRINQNYIYPPELIVTP
jgi:hypothetical protein